MTASPDRAGLDYRDELRRLLDAVHDHETGRMAPHHWSDALKRAHGALMAEPPSWREASRRLHASGDDEPYADESSKTSTPFEEPTT